MKKTFKLPATKCNMQVPTWMYFVILLLLVSFAGLVYNLVTTHRSTKENWTFYAPSSEKFIDAAGVRYVLYYVYMDGCGWCNKFKPTWSAFVEKKSDELRSRSIAVKAIEIGNERPPFEVDGFPTVAMYDVQTKRVVVFEDKRTVAALENFVSSYYVK